MEDFVVNDQPAIKIFANVLFEKETSVFCDCEGDKFWFPKKCIKINKDGTILIQEWLYNEKFEKNNNY